MFIAITRINCLCILVLSWALVVCARGPILAAEPSIVELSTQWAEARQQFDFKKAVGVLDQWIKQQPDRSQLYYLRGCDNFFAGNYRQSVSDFDRLIALDPSRKQSLWERGISLYFAGDFAKGAEQFADYQNYHDQDVENSAFRYLCVAKAEGVKQAQETLLPIENDPRPGLMEVFRLYEGKATPDQVLEDMQKSKLTGQAAAGYRFYTLLYVGLYYDAQGDDTHAVKYLAQASDPKLLEASEQRISRYMWDTARLAHQEISKRVKQAKN
ncbi:tetratricopeptide repeat protein [Blastopirellula marina]|uniref:Uncharacterized protein n=1 Tax=Blastopirellula marina TaxID=124 RepID=A0A2S8G8W4_9BACT|nr:tetratricopeptide repeat protein [Blastopirellula marina]PQO40895.1 hypothetical protein C5Y98_04770 [Blastopirellula marina]PTL45777.1 hypothetical protein C5Y97_04770 [Blastopirellula marina]